MDCMKQIYAVDYEIYAFSYKIKAYSIMDTLDIEITYVYIYI